MNLRLHRLEPQTRVEGPGLRACLWVQGCPIRCPGCFVPWTWPSEGGIPRDVDELAGELLAIPHIEGVTFMGGEPFAQAAALAQLGDRLQAAGRSVVTFTGYTLEQLQNAHDDAHSALLAVTDLLIAGPFVKEALDLSRPWVGSANQRYHFLTDRYRFLEDQLHTLPNRLEVRLRPDGTVSVNGMATQEQLQEVFHTLGRRIP